MKGLQGRILSPDILKIFAAVSVVVIHHKRSSSAHFVSVYNWFYIILIALSLCLGIILALRNYGWKNFFCKDSLVRLLVAPLAAIAFYYLQWFAVCIFLIVSGYLMALSLNRREHPLGFWYTFSNITSRILRFYLPLVPVFVSALLYKIFVLGKTYSALEIVLRFFLGGFKPGSYYITILAQLVLIFPLVYLVVRKYGFSGVMMCTVFTFVYDICSTYFGMNAVLYKFLIFRLTAHVAFGVYAALCNYERERKRCALVFVIGLLYAVCCMYTDVYRPKIFFQWQEASFVTAFYLWPLIMWFIQALKDIKYTSSPLCNNISLVSGSTYHIFLVQLLYYTTIGFELNARIDNFALSVILNLLITLPLGVLYYKIVHPVEDKIVSLIKR